MTEQEKKKETADPYRIMKKLLQKPRKKEDKTEGSESTV